MTVVVNDDDAHECVFRDCGRMGELLITIDSLGELVRRAYCVEHWRSLRSVFIGGNDPIVYGAGAPELIIDRAGARLKTELRQLDAVEQPEDYNRVFCELVALEQQRRQGRP